MILLSVEEGARIRASGFASGENRVGENPNETSHGFETND
jgi:hypothetical protein